MIQVASERLVAAEIYADKLRAVGQSPQVITRIEQLRTDAVLHLVLVTDVESKFNAGMIDAAFMLDVVVRESRLS